jgi:hypothetical protein
MIPLSRPEFGDEEARAVAGVLKTGWVSQGPKSPSSRPRRGASRRRSRRRDDLLHNGAASGAHRQRRRSGRRSHLPVVFVHRDRQLGVYAGAPVFADIEADTWNLDPVDVEKRLSRKTKVILAVHQVGWLPISIG